MTNDSDESWKFENYVEIVQELEGVLDSGEPSMPWVFCPICEVTKLSQPPKMESEGRSESGTVHYMACPQCDFEISYKSVTYVVDLTIPDFENLN
jgi:hypothetical protein